ncbi:MAG: hypothetical protein ACYDG4_12610 [Desulfuromonadaceae bacterium]
MNFKKVVTIAATAGALAALAAPALAEITPYGSVRMTTFWNTVDTNAAGINNGTTTDFKENLHANSRLGVNFSNGTHGGKIELGLNTSAGVSVRHAYGTEKFSFGTVLVGQTENPYYLFSASVAKDDGVNNAYGALWDTRTPQIKLTLNNGFYVSAMMPTTYSTSTTTALSTAATENYLPKMNVGYEGKAGNFAYGAGVVGQMYKQTVAAVGAVPELDDTVTSLLGYFHGKLTAGAAAMQFNLGVGQNMGDMGFMNANNTTDAAAAGATNRYVSKTATRAGEDTLTVEGYVQGSYTLSPMLNLNAGLGYVQDDNDTFVNKDNRMMMFVNTNITVAKGFVVTPEIAYFDQLDQAANNVKGNKEYLVGARWMMNF